MVLRVEADPADVKRCDKARRILPALPLPRLLARGDAVFEELVETLEKPPIKERPENVWVRTGTWTLVDSGRPTPIAPLHRQAAQHHLEIRPGPAHPGGVHGSGASGRHPPPP